MNGHHTTGRYTDIRPIGAHIGYRQAVPYHIACTSYDFFHKKKKVVNW